jgi:hypothetical protein
MFVSLEKKILFFHISKSAGTSIALMLGDMCPDGQKCYQNIFHDNAQHYLTKPILKKWKKWDEEDKFIHITPEDAKPFFRASNIDISDFFCFTIVRNPYERLKSQLQYLNLIEENSIDHYIDTYSILNTQKAGYWFRTQLEYTNNPFTENMQIYKFEELNKLWPKLLEFNDKKSFDIFHVNDNPNKHKQHIEFTMSQKKRIYGMFKEEFETYGYDRGFPYTSGL